MKYYFQLDQQFVSQSAQNVIDVASTKALQDYLSSAQFTDQESYNQFVIGLIEAAKQFKTNTTSQTIFDEELAQVNRKTPLIEPTPWGLVSIQKVDVEKNFIQKLLVIKQNGILGFEYHEKKHEKLNVLEGISLIIYANHAAVGWQEGQMKAQIAGPGDTFEFLPQDEHGMIALTNTVIEETSTNNLDDLIFIFDSKQVI